MTTMTTGTTFRGLMLFAMPALAVAMPVAADDTGFHLGTRLGLARYPQNSYLVVSPSLVLRGQADDSDFTWSIDTGYRFNRYCGIEGSYVDLGEVTSRLADETGVATAQLRFNVKGAAVALVGTLPLGNWQPYIKAGVLIFDTRLAFSGSNAGAAFAADESGSGNDLLYGVGVAYNFGDHWQAKLDATHYNEAGDPDTGNSDVLSLSAGIIWRF